MKKIDKIKNFECSVFPIQIMNEISISNRKPKGFYRGGVLNDKPNGYGVFVELDDNDKLQEKNNTTPILNIYISEWKNGIPEGLGRLLNYYDFKLQVPDVFGMPQLIKN